MLVVARGNFETLDEHVRALTVTDGAPAGVRNQVQCREYGERREEAAQIYLGVLLSEWHRTQSSSAELSKIEGELGYLVSREVFGPTPGQSRGTLARHARTLLAGVRLDRRHGDFLTRLLGESSARSGTWVCVGQDGS